MEPHELDGTWFAYDRWGEGGPLILLVHGNSQSSATFAGQVECLRERLRTIAVPSATVVAIDLPGHGESRRSATPDRDYALSRLRAVVVCAVHDLYRPSSEMLQPRQVVLVGHSLGGHLVLEASADLQNVAGVFLIGTPPVRAVSDFAKAFLPSAASAMPFTGPLTARQVDTWCRAMSRSNTDPPEEWGRAVHDTDPAVREALGRSMLSDPLYDEVALASRLDPPTALLLGADDQMISRSYVEGLRLSNLWNGGLQLIPNAGHFAHVDQPTRVNRLLVEFLSQTVGL